MSGADNFTRAVNVALTAAGVAPSSEAWELVHKRARLLDTSSPNSNPKGEKHSTASVVPSEGRAALQRIAMQLDDELLGGCLARLAHSRRGFGHSC